MTFKALISTRCFHVAPKEELVFENVIFKSRETLEESGFLDESFKKMAGLAAVQNHFRVFDYGCYQFDLPEGANHNPSLDDEAQALSFAISTFFHFLWFVKDHSATYNEIYLMKYDMVDAEKILINARCVIQHGSVTNCVGAKEIATFRKDDFTTAENLLNAFMLLISHTPFAEKVKDDEMELLGLSSIVSRMHYNDLTRFQRAFMFLQSVRGVDILPYKIALYIPILEVLFSTDKTEVVQKVCERTAKYLGGSYEDKRYNFKMIRDAYNVRSRFFHGAEMDKEDMKEGKLEKYVRYLDDIVRRIFTKVILEDSDKFTDKNIEAFHLDLIFRL